MSLFPLKESSVDLRGKTIRFRELSHAERIAFAKVEDRFMYPEVLISMATIDPKITAKEVSDLPSDVAEKLVDAIITFSGMKTGEGDGAKKG